MRYDTALETLSCQSCGMNEEITEHPEHLITATFEENEVKEYNCNNCGAILITEAETTATSCNFCGAGVVIADRLSGHLAPAKVIPFTISKEQAMEAFKKWCKKGFFTPTEFMTADRIKSITGMYVPFWLYDLNSSIQVNAVGTKVRKYTRGDYIYTETNYYDIFRDINLDYVKVPVDASEKMNDDIMDKLEPFPYDQLKEFKTPYLVGYIAEKYNFTDDELLPRAKNKISTNIDSYIRSTLSGYNSLTYQDKKINTQNLKSHYTLLPVWMVSYDYKQSEHTFAMNGQTGKIVGKPPISYGKMGIWFASMSISLFILFMIILFLGEAFGEIQ